MRLNIGQIVNPQTIGLIKNSPFNNKIPTEKIPELNDMAAVAKQRDIMRQEELARSTGKN